VRTNDRSGFTLIELLIVIAIIGILIAAIAVAVTKAKEFANNNDSKANMKNMATACRTMETEHGRLPPCWGVFGRPPSAAPTTLLTSTAFVHMLPYLENAALFDGGTAAYSVASVKVFQSLMDPSLPANPARYTSYVANVRVFSTFGAAIPYNQPVQNPTGTPPTALSSCTSSSLSTDKFVDGPTNTILFSTRYALCNNTRNTFDLYPWYYSVSTTYNGPYFGNGAHTGTTGPVADVAPSGSYIYTTAYQVAPSLATGTAGTNKICNSDMAALAQSFGGAGLAVAMGDTSVRNLSFSVTGDTFAKALCPCDGLPLGSDW
jgi:prepilin-type N-terminal cleavage/methylation domain-containing protein